MKSPEYVRDVAKIYRRLLDECRGADKNEMRELAEIFSRGGFTDGYFTKKIDRNMLGVRSEDDKKNTRELEPFVELTKRIPLEIEAEILRDKPCKIGLVCGGRRVEYISDVIPMEALNAPLTCDSVKKQLTKLGSTVYEAKSFKLQLDDGLMIPVSQLNGIRRAAIEMLEADEKKPIEAVETKPIKPAGGAVSIKSAVFREPRQITQTADEYFDITFLPLHLYDSRANGVALPPVIFDSEREEVEKMLLAAKEKGAEYALVGNLGHIELAKKYGFKLCGDVRLNIFNNSSAGVAEELGFESYVVSPELGLPQSRDIGGAKLAVVYGRLPLMLLEKCVGKELGGCEKCEGGKVTLKDRRGISFPVLREWKHRSLVCNSLPTSMSDKPDLLVKNRISGQHFIFTVESADECDRVITAFKQGGALGCQVRRMGSALNVNE